MIRRIAVILAAGLWAVPATAQIGTGERIASEFARPALQRMADAAAREEEAIAALCETPSEQALGNAHDAFAALIPAWGRASVLRFGPLTEDNRFERLFFWPDPRGIALRQVQGLLASKDADATTVEGVAGKSVALQGIPALEFALYGTGSDALTGKANSFRCRYAQAIAGNMAAISRDVLDGWQNGTEFVQAFTAPTPDSDPYRSAAEVDGEIVKALATTFQYLRAAELLPALGDDAGDSKGKRAALWRSDLSFVLINAQVDGARGLLAAAAYDESLGEDMNWVPGSVLFELDTATQMLGSIETPAESAFADPDDWDKINVASLAVDHAEHLVAQALAAGLGLTMGFNSLDGD